MAGKRLLNYKKFFSSSILFEGPPQKNQTPPTPHEFRVDQVSGLPQHKVRGQHVLGAFRRSLFSLCFLKERMKSQPCQFSLRHLYGRQCRQYELSEVNVVESNDREFLRNGDTLLVGFAHD